MFSEGGPTGGPSQAFSKPAIQNVSQVEKVRKCGVHVRWGGRWSGGVGRWVTVGWEGCGVWGGHRSHPWSSQKNQNPICIAVVVAVAFAMLAWILFAALVCILLSSIVFYFLLLSSIVFYHSRLPPHPHTPSTLFDINGKKGRHCPIQCKSTLLQVTNKETWLMCKCNCSSSLQCRHACVAYIHALYVHALHASLQAWYAYIVPL